MSIPSNLLPLNSSTVSNATNAVGQYTGQIQNVTNQVSTISTTVTQISNEVNIRSGLLDKVIPDSVFSGSVDEIRNKATSVVEAYINAINIPQIPEIPSLIPKIPTIPPIPSYGEIKDYINVRIEAIRAQQIKAFESAQTELVKEAETPFTLMESTISRGQISRVVNNVFPKNV